MAGGGANLSDLLEAFVVIEEEGEILEWHIDFAVAAFRAMLLHCRATATEGVLVDLPRAGGRASCESCVIVSLRPACACARTLSLICLGESVTKMAEFSLLALILVLLPCSAGKNLEWIRAGLR